MDAPPRLHPLIATVLEQVELRANSAIITIFGDAILPRGGGVWLGGLIALARPFGITERLVRTGVYRLTREGWVVSRTQGRRAYYSLTKEGLEKFEEAQQRIYAAEPVEWDGAWTLVHFLADAPTELLRQARRELGWLGFGQLSARLFAHHVHDDAGALRAVQRVGLREHSLIFRGQLHAEAGLPSARRAVHAAWRLDILNADYARFLAKFAPVEEALAAHARLSNADAFVLRILLIHDYRRLLLKDPVLPDALLPAGWTGVAARRLTAHIYKRIAAAADRHLDETITASGEAPPRPGGDYARRFGGLCTPSPP